MERTSFDKLTTNHYKALKALYDRHAVTRDGYRIVAATQREIAELLKVSNPTIVSIFKSLSEDEFIARDESTRGRYYLTNDGLRVVECFEQALRGRESK